MIINDCMSLTWQLWTVKLCGIFYFCNIKNLEVSGANWVLQQGGATPRVMFVITEAIVKILSVTFFDSP